MSVVRNVKRAARDFVADDGLLLAAAVAYYSALSMGPLVLLLLWISGLLGPSAQAALIDQAAELLGPKAGRVLESIVSSAKENPSAGTWAGIFGVVTLAFSATGVFAQLQKAMNRIWDVRVKKGGVKEFLRKRALSLGMILALGFLLLVSLGMSAAVGFLAGKILPGTDILWRILSFLLSVALFVPLFAAMFRYLPDVHIEWRDVWAGAAITAALFALGKLLIGLYLGNAGVGSAYGAAGSLLVLLVWVWFSAVILFFGAEWTQAHARSHGRGLVPEAHAEPIPGKATDRGTKPAKHEPESGTKGEGRVG